MQVEGLSCRVVVVAVVHPAGDRGIVVAQNGVPRQLADLVAALFGLRTIADGVPDADQFVDARAIELA